MKRFFSILLVLMAVVAILDHFDVVEVGQAVSVLVLIATAFVIGKQAWTTEEILEGERRPAVDVSMVFDQGSKNPGTRFQFWNQSDIPALVWITVKLWADEKTFENDPRLLNHDELIGKKEIDVNAGECISTNEDFGRDFFESVTNEGKYEVILKIEVAPAFNKKIRFFLQEKRYRYDKNKREWTRTPFWGIPDRLHPILEEQIRIARLQDRQ